mmetsp:Transcript_114173/g.179742  ORF Transcript_114173/g.179742 Transcript_114173/m.179742 type:complete len:223 (+) Transcript_114173:1730-2398(+)
MSLRSSKSAVSSNAFMNLPRAFSHFRGYPKVLVSNLSTFSHSHDQATSCAVLQSFGSKDRNDASMQDLYSLKFTAPLTTLLMRNTRMSHSSCNRAEFDTFRTMLSKHPNTSFIQALVPKPITAALNLNMSSYVLGTWLADIAVLPFASFPVWSPSWLFSPPSPPPPRPVKRCHKDFLSCCSVTSSTLAASMSPASNILNLSSLAPLSFATFQLASKRVTRSA